MEGLLSFAKTIRTSVSESPNSSTEADACSLHLHHCTTPHVPFSNIFKSRNTPTRARSGFYQKGCCLFQLSVASRCADVFEELGLELQTVSSSSHLLIFFSEFVEVCECIIYDASLCLVTMNANGLLEAEAHPLRSS